MGEYVKLLIEYKYVTAIKQQMDRIMTGLTQVFPGSHLAPFTPFELELLISGVDKVELADWRRHTSLSGYSQGDKTIRYFWMFIGTLDNETKAKVVSMVTGTAKVPMNGFEFLEGND